MKVEIFFFSLLIPAVIFATYQQSDNCSNRLPPISGLMKVPFRPASVDRLAPIRNVDSPVLQPLPPIQAVMDLNSSKRDVPMLPPINVIDEFVTLAPIDIPYEKEQIGMKRKFLNGKAEPSSKFSAKVIDLTETSPCSDEISFDQFSFENMSTIEHYISHAKSHNYKCIKFIEGHLNMPRLLEAIIKSSIKLETMEFNSISLETLESVVYLFDSVRIASVSKLIIKTWQAGPEAIQCFYQLLNNSSLLHLEIPQRSLKTICTRPSDDLSLIDFFHFYPNLTRKQQIQQYMKSFISAWDFSDIKNPFIWNEIFGGVNAFNSVRSLKIRNASNFGNHKNALLLFPHLLHLDISGSHGLAFHIPVALESLNISYVTVDAKSFNSFISSFDSSRLKEFSMSYGPNLSAALKFLEKCTTLEKVTFEGFFCMDDLLLYRKQFMKLIARNIVSKPFELPYSQNIVSFPSLFVRNILQVHQFPLDLQNANNIEGIIVYYSLPDSLVDHVKPLKNLRLLDLSNVPLSSLECLRGLSSKVSLIINLNVFFADQFNEAFAILSQFEQVHLIMPTVKNPDMFNEFNAPVGNLKRLDITRVNVQLRLKIRVFMFLLCKYPSIQINMYN